MMQKAWSNIEDYRFSRSTVKFQGHKWQKITEFYPTWAFPDCNFGLDSLMATKWCTTLGVARADQGSVKAPCQYRLAMGSINEGSAFSMHPATKFKCNFVVIGVVHSGIKMTGSYLSEFRWDEKCCNSLHEYKDYSKTHPLPQYAQMINFIPNTQCSPKWYCDACRTARAWRKRMAQRCPVNRQHRVFFYMRSLGF